MASLVTSSACWDIASTVCSNFTNWTLVVAFTLYWAFNIGFFFYCLFFAATELPGGMAALVMSFQPMLVMMMSWILLSTRITPLQWVAGGVGIIGIGLLVLNQTASLSIQGLLIACLGTFSMALWRGYDQKMGPSSRHVHTWIYRLAITVWWRVFTAHDPVD
ncbi:EamA family transporter [Vibrio metschnikovii]